MTFPRTPNDSTRTDEDTVDVVLSEERLSLTTETYATERIRLERVVVTEQRTLTVDVRREEIRITREPLSAGAPLPIGSAGADRAPLVITLHEEQITVTRTIVPVERVTLTVEAVTEDREITSTVRREVVDVVSTTVAPSPGVLPA